MRTSDSEENNKEVNGNLQRKNKFIEENNTEAESVIIIDEPVIIIDLSESKSSENISQSLPEEGEIVEETEQFEQQEKVHHQEFPTEKILKTSDTTYHIKPIFCPGFSSGCYCSTVNQHLSENIVISQKYTCICSSDFYCCLLVNYIDAFQDLQGNNKDKEASFVQLSSAVEPDSGSDSDIQIIEDTPEKIQKSLPIEQIIASSPLIASKINKTYYNVTKRTTTLSGRVIKKPHKIQVAFSSTTKRSQKLTANSTKNSTLQKNKPKADKQDTCEPLPTVEFIDCGEGLKGTDKENVLDPQPGTSKGNGNTTKSRPYRTTLNNKRRRLQEDSSNNSNKKNDSTMSMYDYRQFSDIPPASTGYYTSKATNVVNEDQTNNTNSAAQNLLDSNKTIATLCNIGNSCYLNSVVYTLRFAPLFLHKLHHLIEDMATIYIKLNPTKHKSSSLGRNVSLWQGHSGRSWSSKDLASLGSITGNDSLPKNNRLIVTEKLHELYQNLHKNESSLNTEPLHAGPFLQAIQDVCSIFEGNQQQDAHECLMCILDSIRETCDTLATAIIENPEQLLTEYGLGSLIEESRSGEDLQTQQNPQVAQSTSNSSKPSMKFFSRKSKRKKPDDENAIGITGKPPQVPESPIRDKDGQAGTTNKSSSNQDATNTADDGSPSAATSPTGTLDPKNNTRNAILKALAGDNDINDKEKLKENVCKLLGLNFFCEDFEGVTVSSIKCLTCESVKTLKEKMIDISVPISGHENPDTMSNPQIFFQNSCITKEYFRGENKYRCETCFGYEEAIRSISYELLPRLLVIHLKRFSGGMEKINSYIPTPFTLKCFCNRCYNLPDDKKLHIYKLYSVITHVGATMSVGHYVAYTCALDIQNEYRVCTNERSSKIATLVQLNKSNNGSSGGNGNGTTENSSRSSNPSLATTGTNGTDKGGRSIKRLLFGSKKASSSNDLKQIKTSVNGLMTKVVANGMEKLNLGMSSSSTGNNVGNNGSPINCQGVKCCGIHVKNSKLLSNNGSFVSYLNGTGHVNGTTSTNGTTTEMDSLAPPPSTSATKPSSSDLSIASTTSSSGIGITNHIIDDDINNISSSSKTTLASNISQDYWYMCDDDKIKVMPQHQFEDYLSPNRKNMITPYLLFYARFDASPPT